MAAKELFSFANFRAKDPRRCLHFDILQFVEVADTSCTLYRKARVGVTG